MKSIGQPAQGKQIVLLLSPYAVHVTEKADFVECDQRSESAATGCQSLYGKRHVPATGGTMELSLPAKLFAVTEQRQNCSLSRTGEGRAKPSGRARHFAVTE